MFHGILADALLCPLPSPPLLHATDILDSFLGIWHMKNLIWLGGMWKDWNWVFQQQLWDILVTQGRCKHDWTLWMQIHMSWWHCCASQQYHTSRGKSPPSAGVRAPVLGRAPARWPCGLDSKYLGAWKGPHLDAFPHISFALSFSKEKEMEGKALAGLLPYLLWGRWWWSQHGLSWGIHLSQFSCPATQPICSGTAVRLIPTLT